MIHHHRFRGQRYSSSLSHRDTSISVLLSSVAVAYLASPVCALHHMQQPPIHIVNRANSDLPLVVTNNCEQTIYPAILTQAGTGPGKSGFRLNAGDTLPQTVSADWKGRVWGRTNCSFTDDGSPASGQGGRACSSGDCGAFVECQGAVSMRTLLISGSDTYTVRGIPQPR